MSVRSTHLGEEQDVLLLLLLLSMVPTLTLAAMSTGEEDEEKEEEEELSTYPDLYVLLHPILSLYRSFFSGFYLFFFSRSFFSPVSELNVFKTSPAPVSYFYRPFETPNLPRRGPFLEYSIECL